MLDPRARDECLQWQQIERPSPRVGGPDIKFRPSEPDVEQSSQTDTVPPSISEGISADTPNSGDGSEPLSAAKVLVSFNRYSWSAPVEG